MSSTASTARKIFVGIAVIWTVISIGYWAVQQSGLGRKIEERAAEAIGEIASERIASYSEQHGHGQGDDTAGGRNAGQLEQVPVEVNSFNDFVHIAYGVGNTALVQTADGNVLIDTGLSTQGAKQKRLLQEVAPGRASHIVLSHAHADHIGGARFWADEQTEIITSREFVRKQGALKSLESYFWNRNRLLYPFMPEKPAKNGLFSYGGIEPTRTIVQDETYSFTQGGISFEVIATPGAEGLDNIVVWLPEHKILFSGDFFGPIFPMVPNLFTLRGEKFRPPVEYMESLQKLIDLGPEVIIPAHFDPVVGADKIRGQLQASLDATRYIHDETIKGMNAGKSLWELMKTIQLPPELALTQAHGKVSWDVRSIWEYYATWFRFESTTELYPVPVNSIYGELRELAGGNQALLDRAQQHFAAGEPEKALHYIEIASAAGPDKAAEQLRLQVLKMMLQRAFDNGGNYSETGWLNGRIRETQTLIDSL